MKNDRISSDIAAELPARRGERGSAYMAVLLALVVLTILGLSLVLITQTEVQVGANERTVTQTLYAADAGFGAIIASADGSPDFSPVTFKLNQVDLGGNSHVADVVTAIIVPLTEPPCSGCSMNLGGSGTTGLKDTTNLVTVTADRVSWVGPGTGLPPANATILGEKTLSQVHEFPFISSTNGPSVPDASYTASRE